MYSGATGLWERIRESWRDPMVRRNAGYLMAGKMIGLGLVLLLIMSGAVSCAVWGLRGGHVPRRKAELFRRFAVSLGRSASLHGLSARTFGGARKTLNAG